MSDESGRSHSLVTDCYNGNRGQLSQRASFAALRGEVGSLRRCHFTPVYRRTSVGTCPRWRGAGGGGAKMAASEPPL